MILNYKLLIYTNGLSAIMAGKIDKILCTNQTYSIQSVGWETTFMSKTRTMPTCLVCYHMMWDKFPHCLFLLIFSSFIGNFFSASTHAALLTADFTMSFTCNLIFHCHLSCFSLRSAVFAAYDTRTFKFSRHFFLMMANFDLPLISTLCV